MLYPCAAVIYAAELLTNTTCAVTEGHIQIEITGNSRSWSYLWTGGNLVLSKRSWKAFSPAGVAPRGSVYGDFFYNETHLLGVKRDIFSEATRLNAPYTISPDGGLLIATVYPAHGALSASPQNGFVIVDLPSGAIIRRVDATFAIDAFAWAPSSNQFVALLSEEIDVWKGPIERLAANTGHGVPYYSLHVAVFRKDGSLVCTRLVRKKERYGSGYVVWKDREKMGRDELNSQELLSHGKQEIARQKSNALNTRSSVDDCNSKKGIVGFRHPRQLAFCASVRRYA